MKKTHLLATALSISLFAANAYGFGVPVMLTNSSENLLQLKILQPATNWTIAPPQVLAPHFTTTFEVPIWAFKTQAYQIAYQDKLNAGFDFALTTGPWPRGIADRHLKVSDNYHFKLISNSDGTLEIEVW